MRVSGVAVDITIDKEFAAMIPPLSAEERQQLEENIVEHGGARDPLVVWNERNATILLDGHNRYEICTRLDLDFDVEEREFTDRSHAVEWIIRNQFGRRNLAAYVRTQLALRLKETIADRAKANQKQSEGRGKKGSEKSPDLIDTREEVAKAAGVSSNTVSKVEKIVAAEEAGKVDADTVAKLRTGEVSINRVVRDLKNQEASERRSAEREVAKTRRKHVDGLYHGDFREIGDKIPDASVDLIFTDPPYDRKAIELFDGLGEFASRVLRPGGSLVAYIGHIQLPDAVEDLSKHLRYWWTCACVHGGQQARMTEYGIVAGWKPILWFVKETRGDKQTFINDTVTSQREKSHHEWQQSLDEARYFIDLLTEKDGFVVDPFCGGGTTAVAAIQLGRKWASFEIDEANVARASERIQEGTK